MKTGIGLVRGQRKKERTWNLSVERGRKELRGVSIVVRGPVIVGRSPGADIVVGAGYVSGRHARFSLMGQNLFVEDLGSTNGTAVNGQVIGEPGSAQERRRGQRGRRGHPREVRLMAAERPYKSTPHTRKGATTTFGSRTDIGCLRDHNEDSLVVTPPLFAVADGMGGHARRRSGLGNRRERAGRARSCASRLRGARTRR